MNIFIFLSSSIYCSRPLLQATKALIALTHLHKTGSSGPLKPGLEVKKCAKVVADFLYPGGQTPAAMQQQQQPGHKRSKDALKAKVGCPRFVSRGVERRRGDSFGWEFNRTLPFVTIVKSRRKPFEWRYISELLISN